MLRRIRETQVKDWFKDLHEAGGAFVGAGIIIAGIGNLLNFDRLLTFGIALLGAGILAWGLDGVLQERIAYYRARFSEKYYALAARAWGLFLALAGFLMFGYGVLATLDPHTRVPGRVGEWLKTETGSSVLMVIIGLVGALNSFSTILGTEEDRGSFFQLLLSVPGRLVGVLVFVSCLGLSALGVLRLVAPQIVEQLGRAILNAIGLP